MTETEVIEGDSVIEEEAATGTEMMTVGATMEIDPEDALIVTKKVTLLGNAQNVEFFIIQHANLGIKIVILDQEIEIEETEETEIGIADVVIIEIVTKNVIVKGVRVIVEVEVMIKSVNIVKEVLLDQVIADLTPKLNNYK